MRSMTEEQARNYILTGYFPNSTDIEAIVDLQDVYAHQRYWSCVKWLFDEETHNNALKLYELIWDEIQMTSLLRAADKIHETEHLCNNIEAECKSLQFQLEIKQNQLEQQVRKYSKYMELLEGN